MGGGGQRQGQETGRRFEITWLCLSYSKTASENHSYYAIDRITQSVSRFLICFQILSAHQMQLRWVLLSLSNPTTSRACMGCRIILNLTALSQLVKLSRLNMHQAVFVETLSKYHLHALFIKVNCVIKVRQIDCTIGKALIKIQHLYEPWKNHFCGSQVQDGGRWALSSPPPKNTSNVHLYLKKSLLKDNCELTEQLLHIEKVRKPWKLFGN